jgi:hypothetical protein
MSTLPITAIAPVSPVSAGTAVSPASPVTGAQRAGSGASPTQAQQERFEALLQQPGMAGAMPMALPMMSPLMSMPFPKLALDNAEDEDK